MKRKRSAGKRYRKVAAALTLLLAFAALCGGCARRQGVLNPDVTLPPAVTPVPTPALTPSPVPAATPEAIAEATPEPVDYWAYLSFRNIYVYEESGDTFFQGVVNSEYPGRLIAVLDVFFYNDDKNEIARGRLLNGEGGDVLVFAPGETRVYARVDTDMSVTALDFGFESVGDPLTALD